MKNQKTKNDDQLRKERCKPVDPAEDLCEEQDVTREIVAMAEAEAQDDTDPVDLRLDLCEEQDIVDTLSA